MNSAMRASVVNMKTTGIDYHLKTKCYGYLTTKSCDYYGKTRGCVAT